MISFKVDSPGLWGAYSDGSKTWAGVFPWVITDERIHKLSWGKGMSGHWSESKGYVYEEIPILARDKHGCGEWKPIETQVSFVNTLTGETLTFEYLGVEFLPWAPGWGFIRLGKRLEQ